jgi:DNA-binding NarL/FixJ family response regulator
MPGAAEGKIETGLKHRVLAYTTDVATRYLLDICIDTGKFELQYANTSEDAFSAAEKKGVDILVLDSSDGQLGADIVRRIADAKWKHLVRVVLLMDKAPKPGSNHMQPFGPFCMLEAFFTRQRLNATLNESLTIKDTGSRVRADDKFFDVTIFNKRSADQKQEPEA